MDDGGAGRWLADVAQLIARVPSDDFAAEVDAFLMRVAGFDMSVVLSFSFGERPVLLHDGYRGLATRSSLDAYLGGAYLFDPFYTASVGDQPNGLWRMRELSPEHFFETGFYNDAEVHPCISMEAGSLVEEIGFIIRLDGGRAITYSLMRSKGRTPFSESEMTRLKTVEPVIRELCHLKWNRPAKPSDGDASAMESAFMRFRADTLTLRQRKIVRLILRGHGNAAISDLLAISVGTVKNHRKNIYRRLNISSQNELFSLFMKETYG